MPKNGYVFGSSAFSARVNSMASLAIWDTPRLRPKSRCLCARAGNCPGHPVDRDWLAAPWVTQSRIQSLYALLLSNPTLLIYD